MNYDDIIAARDTARDTLRYADMATRQAARLIKERLRAAEVDTDTLRALKRELQHFNANTRKWSDK